MKKIIMLMLLAVAVAVAPQVRAQDAPAKAPTKNPRLEGKFQKILSNAEFDALMQNPDKVLIIDIRLPLQIVQAGGFPVFMYILASGTDYINIFMSHTAEIPKDRQLIIVDNQGHRSLNLCNLLDAKGFKIAGALGEEVYAQNGGTVLKYELPKPGEAPAAEK